VQCRIEDLDIGVALNIAGGNLSRSRLRDRQRLRLVPVQLERDLLEIKNHVGGIFDHAFDRRELMLNAFDLDRGNSRALDR